MELSTRFSEALELAFSLHREQQRKGSGVPYFAHLMAVSGLVLEAGGEEDVAIAALLHDAVEDQGGLDTLGVLRERFGDRVAEIVLACSDSTEAEKPPWRQRKERYLAHLETAPDDVLMVSCADKLHNARSILADHHVIGPAIWDRFKPSREQTLWYYRTLLEIFSRRGPSGLSSQLRPVIEALEHLP